MFLSFVPFQILKWTRQHSREIIFYKVKRYQHPIVANTDIVAAEIVEDLQAALAQLTRSLPLLFALTGLPIYVAASQLAQFAEIAADLKL